MAGHDRDHYVALVEERYFGSLMRDDIAAALTSFTADAEVVIYHGDNPVRRFYGRPAAGQSPLAAFYEHLVGNYHTHFGQFTHVVDREEERCAATFTVTLTPRPGSAYEATGTLTLNNSNFFRCRDGRIAHMIIYYANPTLGAQLGAGTASPTGFPKDRSMSSD